MKSLENIIFVVAVMLAVPALRKATMMLALTGLTLARAARSSEREPVLTPINSAKRKDQHRH